MPRPRQAAGIWLTPLLTLLMYATASAPACAPTRRCRAARGYACAAGLNRLLLRRRVLRRRRFIARRRATEPAPTAHAGTAMSSRTTTAGPHEFVRGKLAVAVLVQRLQSRGCVGQFVGINDTIAIGIQSGNDRRDGRMVGATTGTGFPYG